MWPPNSKKHREYLSTPSDGEKTYEKHLPLRITTGSNRTRLVRLLAVAILIILIATFQYAHAGDNNSAQLLNEAESIQPEPLIAAALQTKNAFCVFLDRDSASKQDDGSDDRYFIATRMIIYQLLHDSATRTKTKSAFVVIVSDNVNDQRRERLKADGAIVVEADGIATDPTFQWIKPGRDRWAHVIDKLHVFKLTMFERVLLFDSDTVIVRRIDDLFTSPESALVMNKGNASEIKDDEASQPSNYVMAGNSGPYSQDHSYPAPRGDKLNAGFVLLKPSMEMYNYYLSVAALEDRFNPSSPEQNLWNYAHRLQGNMPWVQINPDWTANTPNYGDFEHGIATFHEKWWACEKDLKLRDVLLRSRWKMEGYWLGKERNQKAR